MQKIPSLFVRDYEKPVFTDIEMEALRNGTYGFTKSTREHQKGRFLATEQVTPGCEWVINGEGIATRKWDGTAVMVKDGLLYKRYDAKNGKTPPDGAIPCQEPDPVTGHWPHWILVDPHKKEDKYIWEAYENSVPPSDGTYEAIGPKINGNKDGISEHRLVKHGDTLLVCYKGEPLTFDMVRNIVSAVPWEGIVFHHPDGRMCKVKRSDFGLPW